MPKSSPIQTNFSGGELGASVEGRVELEKHGTGLEFCQNYIPTLEGPLTRTPGTKRVVSVKDPSRPPRLIPFKFNNDEQYLLEVGDKYMRFFSDEGAVITSGTSYQIIAGLFTPAIEHVPSIPVFETVFYGSRTNRTARPREVLTINNSAITYPTTFSSVPSGSLLEIKTPFDYEMVPNIGWAQQGDTLWLMHSSRPTFTLQRFGVQDWDIKYFATQDGPYRNINTSQRDGDNSFNSLIASRELNGFVYLRAHSSNLIHHVINNIGQVEVRTSAPHNRVSGDRVWISGVTGATSINNGSSFTTIDRHDSSVWFVQTLSATSLILVGSVGSSLVMTGSTGQMFPAIFRPEDRGRNMAVFINAQRHYGWLGAGSSFTDIHTAGGTGWPQLDFARHPIQEVLAVHPDSGAFPVGTNICAVWQMGAHGWDNGWPSSGAFHQDRLVFAGTPGIPGQFNTSETGQYKSFALDTASSLITTDASAIQFTLASDSSDRLQWVKSGKQGLYFGSETTEFLVSPSRDGQSLSQTNINNDIIGNYGSAPVNPVRFGDAVIYLQNSQRKVRELRYFANLQSHKSTNINQLSDHIGFPEIVGMATQKEFYPLIWAYKSDGELISMSYSRDDSQVISGWARHQLGGVGDVNGGPPKVLGIEVMRNSLGTYDQLWMVVKRIINGTSDVGIEYMTEPYRHKDPTQKQRDAYYLSCGVSYERSSVITDISIDPFVTDPGSMMVSIPNGTGVPFFQTGDYMLIEDVVGFNQTSITVSGVIVSSNLVNGRVFQVGTTNGIGYFNAVDITTQSGNGSIFSGYGAYAGGGIVRRLNSSVVGLTWLKNEVVNVLGDGRDLGEMTVSSSGVLSLTATPAAVVQLGYSYKSRVKTLSREQGSATGSAIGALKRTYSVAFRLRDIGDLKYGGIDFYHLHQADFLTSDQQQLDEAVPLFTGIFRSGIEQDVEFGANVYFEQSSPLPGMIQSITFFMDEYDL